MRKTKNITKRVAIAILAAALTMTQVSATVVMNPIVVMAQDLENNPEDGETSVSAGSFMSNNYGTVVENNGSIRWNEGTGVVKSNKSGSNYNEETGRRSDDTTNQGIQNNYGTVEVNEINGRIDFNNNALTTNNGLVDTNSYGSQIDTNSDTGTVNINNGTINTSYGTVQDNRATIENNRGGSVYNRGSASQHAGAVTNLYDGTVISDSKDNVITNMYGGNIGGSYMLTGTVTNFYSGSLNNDTFEFIGAVVNNYGEIDVIGEGGTVTNNFNTIVNNKGTVTENKTPSDDGSMPALITTNNGTVTTNNGVVTTNNSGLDDSNADDGTGVRTNNGEVTTNNGCVDINNGLVGLSYGKVGTNNGNELSEDGTTVVKGVVQNEGSIDDNNGLVVYNSHSLMTNNTNGVVNINNDTIDVNYGTIIENHEGGLVGDGNYGDITTNNGTVNDNYRNEMLGTGDITINNGWVKDNYGIIEENNGNVRTGNWDNRKGVRYNQADGEIQENNGYVFANRGIININEETGYIESNYDNNPDDNLATKTAKILVNKGTVESNTDIIELNIGTVNQNVGVITNNFGSVATCGDTDDNDNQITFIVNQYDGTITDGAANSEENTVITNFFGGTVEATHVEVTNNFSDVDAITPDVISNATNQYRSVSFVADEHSSATYNDDFTKKDLINRNGEVSDTRYYINVTSDENGNGTITIVADPGYKIAANGANNGTIARDTYAFNYTLVADGNNYKLNITGYNGNSCELSNDMFGLVVSAIQNVNPNQNPNPNPRPNPNPSPSPQPSPGPQPNPSPEPQPSPQPSSVNPDVPVAPIEDNAKYPSVIAVPVVQYANNARLSSTMAMPNIAMPNIENANEMHNMVSIISGTPMGGTAMLSVTGDRLDASVVAALLSRRDINVNIACFVNGRLSLIIIPANADLTDVIEADGSISIARLADTFGSTGM